MQVSVASSVRTIIPHQQGELSNFEIRTNTNPQGTITASEARDEGSISKGRMRFIKEDLTTRSAIKVCDMQCSWNFGVLTIEIRDDVSVLASFVCVTCHWHFDNQIGASLATVPKFQRCFSNRRGLYVWYPARCAYERPDRCGPGV